MREDFGGLAGICMKRRCKRMRLSSCDPTGGNDDWLWIEAGSARDFAEISGAGYIRHIWITTECDEEYHLRKCSLEIYWDDERSPSVNTPLGDFFGMGHGVTRSFVSEPFQMSAKDGKGLNCYFPMPYRRAARFRIVNGCQSGRLMFYFHIDYEEYSGGIDCDALYFHACFHRQNPTDGIEEDGLTNDFFNFTGGKNTDGAGNYVLLSAKGQGHYVGCNLNIHNSRDTDEFDWYGEGDEMIFIDDEPWPPRIHGTGMEDYFNAAWAPGGVEDKYIAPHHGLILSEGPNYKGRHSWYRYHIHDPVVFEKSILVTIEHGHNNHRSDDYSSTVYWYQTEPHLPFALLPVCRRIPRGLGRNGG